MSPSQMVARWQSHMAWCWAVAPALRVDVSASGVYRALHTPPRIASIQRDTGTYRGSPEEAKLRRRIPALGRHSVSPENWYSSAENMLKRPVA